MNRSPSVAALARPLRALRLGLHFALALSPSAALAGSGDAVLAQVDAALNRASDTTSRMSAETNIPGQAPLKMEFTLETKGPKRMVEFHAPGDMKGTRVLVLDRRQMYVYLPAYNKVRRIASHVNSQGFMGTMFADADMSTTRFGEAYAAELKGETEAGWTLSLSPKPGEETAYARLEIDVSKQNTLPTTIRYYDAKGTHLKTEVRSQYVCEAQVCQPGHFKMTDHTRKDASTVLIQKMEKMNSGLNDERFSQRALQQGR